MVIGTSDGVEIMPSLSSLWLFEFELSSEFELMSESAVSIVVGD